MRDRDQLAQDVANRNRASAADVVYFARFAVPREVHVRVNDVAHVEEIPRGIEIADEELRRSTRSDARQLRRERGDHKMLLLPGTDVIESAGDHDVGSKAACLPQ